MYVQVASKLVVTFGTEAVSQAVSMTGANAVEVEATLFVKGGGDLTITVQEGNDLENWTSVGTSITLTGVGYGHQKVTGIASQYVRLKYSQATSGTGIVAAGINTASL